MLQIEMNEALTKIPSQDLLEIIIMDTIIEYRCKDNRREYTEIISRNYIAKIIKILVSHYSIPIRFAVERNIEIYEKKLHDARNPNDVKLIGREKNKRKK